MCFLRAGFDGTGNLSYVFDGRWCSTRDFADSTTLDDNSVRVSEFDVDVLLVDARELSVKMIAVLYLADVKAWGEGTNRACVVGASHVIHLREQAVERLDVGGVEEGVREGTAEDRHVAGWLCFDNLRDCWTQSACAAELHKVELS